MVISNIVPNKTIIIPDLLKDKIELRFTCHMDDEELKIYALVLQYVAIELLNEGYEKDNLSSVTIIFTDTNVLTFTEDSKSCGGCNFSLIIYYMDKLRLLNNFLKMALTFIEELVHHFWRIEDEKIVKYKDLKIIQHLNNTVTIETLKEWGVKF